MAKVYTFLANGFEEIEAVAPVDILRRGGVEVTTVSITDSLYVESAHGITMKADACFANLPNLDDADMLLLPGGMPGAANLNAHEGLRQALLAHHNAGKHIGAICAAPMVLGSLGILKGRNATCYPGFEKYLDGATYTPQLVQQDGHITTGEGPAAALPYGYTLLSHFVGEAKTQEIEQGMMYAHLMKRQ